VKVSPLDGPSTPLRVPAPFLADNVKKAAESLCTELKEIEELEAECQRRRIALQRDRSPVRAKPSQRQQPSRTTKNHRERTQGLMQAGNRRRRQVLGDQSTTSSSDSSEESDDDAVKELCEQPYEIIPPPKSLNDKVPEDLYDTDIATAEDKRKWANTMRSLGVWSKSISEFRDLWNDESEFFCHAFGDLCRAWCFEGSQFFNEKALKALALDLFRGPSGNIVFRPMETKKKRCTRCGKVQRCDSCTEVYAGGQTEAICYRCDGRVGHVYDFLSYLGTMMNEIREKPAITKRDEQIWFGDFMHALACCRKLQ